MNDQTPSVSECQSAVGTVGYENYEIISVDHNAQLRVHEQTDLSAIRITASAGLSGVRTIQAPLYVDFFHFSFFLFSSKTTGKDLPKNS